MEAALADDGPGFFKLHGFLNSEHAITIADEMRSVPTSKMRQTFNQDLLESTVGDGISQQQASGHRFLRRLDSVELGSRPWAVAAESIRDLCAVILRSFKTIAVEQYVADGPVHYRSVGECFRQMAHCDAGPCSSDVPALTVLLGVDAVTMLSVFGGSHRMLKVADSGCCSTIDLFDKDGALLCFTEDVVLGPGDAVVFRQDLLHHGAGSLEQNDRLFWFLGRGPVRCEENLTRPGHPVEFYQPEYCPSSR